MSVGSGVTIISDSHYCISEDVVCVTAVIGCPSICENMLEVHALMYADGEVVGHGLVAAYACADEVDV